MIFLIRYNRRMGRIVSFEVFDDLRRIAAENRRLELELELNRDGVRDEIVLLQAASEEALRITHRRYFETAKQIATTATGGTTGADGSQKP
jgi:hypothetical protein